MSKQMKHTKIVLKKSSSRFYDAFQLRFAAWNDENWIKNSRDNWRQQKKKLENEGDNNKSSNGWKYVGARKGQCCL